MRAGVFLLIFMAAPSLKGQVLPHHYQMYPLRSGVSYLLPNRALGKYFHLKSILASTWRGSKPVEKQKEPYGTYLGKFDPEGNSVYAEDKSPDWDQPPFHREVFASWKADGSPEKIYGVYDGQVYPPENPDPRITLTSWGAETMYLLTRRYNLRDTIFYEYDSKGRATSYRYQFDSLKEDSSSLAEYVYSEDEFHIETRHYVIPPASDSLILVETEYFSHPSDSSPNIKSVKGSPESPEIIYTYEWVDSCLTFTHTFEAYKGLHTEQTRYFYRDDGLIDHIEFWQRQHHKKEGKQWYLTWIEFYEYEFW